jgi:hypothetical protein
MNLRNLYAVTRKSDLRVLGFQAARFHDETNHMIYSVDQLPCPPREISRICREDSRVWIHR